MRTASFCLCASQVLFFVHLSMCPSLTVCQRKKWKATDANLIKDGMNVCYGASYEWLNFSDIWPLTFDTDGKSLPITWKQLVSFWWKLVVYLGQISMVYLTLTFNLVNYFCNCQYFYMWHQEWQRIGSYSNRIHDIISNILINYTFCGLCFMVLNFWTIG